MTIPVNFPSWLRAFVSKNMRYLYSLKVVYTHVWDLHTFTLASLALQSLLILLAPFRKKSANGFILVSIWLAYLLADYVAIQAVGLVPKLVSKATHGASELVHHTDPNLIAFWSPFLLVHLGGPDTITALSLEDNALWLRTFVHLCTQVTATARVFLQALPNRLLWLPTVLMFAAGLLKYMERTLSLYHARLDKFKASMLTDPVPGTHYNKFMESYFFDRASNLEAKFHTNPRPHYSLPHSSLPHYSLPDPKSYDSDQESQLPPNHKLRLEKGNVILVREAFELFEKYKGLYVDLIFSFHDRKETRASFLKRNAEEAFKVIEIELNFTYEVFFTKMVVIHRKFGKVMRCISCACEVLSLIIWILLIDTRNFHSHEINITYTLLGGAIVLDAIAVLRVLLSDWNIAHLDSGSIQRARLYNKFLSARNRTWGMYWRKEECPWMPYLRRILFRRWSESVQQFNLIDYTVNPWSKLANSFFKIVPFQEQFDEIYVSKKWFADELRDFIFNEIKIKAQIADYPKDAQEVYESKGDWVLRYVARLDFNPFEFYSWTVDVEYDECLLLWHVATELLYQEDQKDYHADPPKKNSFRQWMSKCAPKVDAGEKKKPTEKDYCKTLWDYMNSFHQWLSKYASKADSGEKKEPTEKDYRNYCKTLSDYMMYLLNRQKVMMLPVAGISEVRFRDTCAEADLFFKRVLPKEGKKEIRHKFACKKIMAVKTDNMTPKEIKRDGSKSVLFEACRLAKALEMLKDQNVVGMWELMARVWVELLCYSAAHCKTNGHAAQLKQGGELVSLVWLLMVHMGLGRQFHSALF